MTAQQSLNKQLGTEDIIWKLEDLYPSITDQKVEDDITFCKKTATRISENYTGKIHKLKSNEIASLVTEIESLHTVVGKLYTFSFLHFITQVDNDEATIFYQRIKEIISEVEQQTIFFDLEWNQLDDEITDTFLNTQELANYKHYLAILRRYKPHQLSQDKEQLLIERKIVGRSSWNILFEKVIGHLRFGKNLRTEEEVLSDLYDGNQNVRITAQEEMTEGLASQLHILTHIFNTLAAEKMIHDRQRSYHSWVSAMNLDNQVKDQTVTALVTAVTSRYDIVSRYYTLKKNLLKLDTLYDYDRYAPLPDLPAKQVTWQDCKNIVLQSFSDFSSDMAAIAEDFFSKQYIHAPILKAKRGGAFAHPCVPQVHPYVMVNYTGTLRDISTVAHELGHGVHQVLAAEKGYFNSETPLVLAETASVFAELLVFKSQLALLKSKNERRAFVCQKLESIFATVFRQTAMNRFEHAMHTGRRETGELSTDELNSYWIETQQELFGDSVKLTDNYKIWWSYIPHFLSTPGYVYSYAFGELLVLSLYSIYEENPDSFVPTYMELLKAGGSASPYELLAPFSIDLDDASFWHQGLKRIDAMLQEIEK